ncbi:hypothetical protein C9374_012940 [Naegleria lovaniensis]|uniref:Acyl-coenzyme A oxidase n=1 Tax=Naegleria lovaniensis TaxID=51637 RepID=A0AA88KHL7_NAELO|nr:uncharacterized protein C9374_012940 [Naegleria lovaniensis]KAG2372997.1 hypothetical protein C9374_012940 [Naegleria lovaniensis]
MTNESTLRRIQIVSSHLLIPTDQKQQQQQPLRNVCNQETDSNNKVLDSLNAMHLNPCSGEYSGGMDLPSHESLRRYHLQLKRQDIPLLPNTKSLKELKAFYARDSNSLSSRLLQSMEAPLFSKGFTQTREGVWRVLAQEQSYYVDNEWSVHQYRQQLDMQFREFMKHKLLSTELMNENIYAFLGAAEAALSYDVSFAAKLVVSLQLYGTCIYRLGTEKHRHLLMDLNRAQDIGCFMMTEIAHGSNVRGIETTATFDPNTKEFVIHSPTKSSYKYWIGNSAVYGTKACVFAQLIVNNENKGVHVFVVPIRDPLTLELYDGIQIKDIGVKQGWNAVDNGCIAFEKVRVPLDSLLNRYGEVTPDGKYVSAIKDEGARFGVTLSALSMGRLLYIAGPTFALKAGLTTAIRYAHQRRQFGNKDNKENLIWEYPTHHDLILPMLANTFAFFSGFTTLSDDYTKSIKDHAAAEDFHAIVSGVKAYTCEYATPALRELRVACGGHGYSNNNRIGILMNDMCVFGTAEGDSIVLYQQLAKYLFEKAKKKSASSPVLKEIFTAENKSKITNATSDILKLDVQKKALAFRVKKLLEECQSQIGSYLKQQKDFQTAWNLSLVKIIELARSYVELELLFRIQEGLLKNAVDQETRDIFKTISDIYAVSVLRQNLSFYLIHQYFDIETAQVIMDKTLPALYQKVKSLTLDIVEAFNIPDFLLRAPIGIHNQNYVDNTLQSIGFY